MSRGPRGYEATNYTSPLRLEIRTCPLVVLLLQLFSIISILGAQVRNFTEFDEQESVVYRVSPFIICQVGLGNHGLTLSDLLTTIGTVPATSRHYYIVNTKDTETSVLTKKSPFVTDGTTILSLSMKNGKLCAKFMMPLLLTSFLQNEKR
ncbi:hypothetical protein F5B21DRAFT_317296 [Xylaria acuta]|nr:hypothetical protein F5B21DRAFT_317296 [Xylaria acuta]